MGKHQAKSAAAKNGGSYHPPVAHGRRVRKVEPFRILFEIVASLEAAHISHAVTKYRYDAVSIVAHLPGERWEIDILEDGDLDFERFVSDGQILEREDLNVYIKRFAD